MQIVYIVGVRIVYSMCG